MLVGSVGLPSKPFSVLMPSEWDSPELYMTHSEMCARTVTIIVCNYGTRIGRFAKEHNVEEPSTA